jgi:hypothetical protein
MCINYLIGEPSEVGSSLLPMPPDSLMRWLISQGGGLSDKIVAPYKYQKQ